MAVVECPALGRVVEARFSGVNILLIAQAFPPFNTSGALRVGRFASFLLDRQHDVRVLTASPLPYPRGLNLGIPAQRVIETRSFDPFAMLAKWRRPTPQGQSNGSASAAQSRVRLRRWLNAAAVPEPQAGWYPYAVAAGKRLLENWTPDVIYASALPFTAHLVAARLARGTHVPWIAEFRDHYFGNPYSNLPAWRAPIDRFIEARVVRSAAACVTVSESMAYTLERRYRKPTVVVLNGCDPRPLVTHDVNAPGQARLNILYTGVIYPGRRDPSALFQAIAALGDRASDVEVNFYGQDLRGVRELAEKFAVTGSVGLHAPVAHAESLALQGRADVLLLLLWNDPREFGIYTGKLFEYVGSRRPILAVGTGQGVAADLIRSRKFGFASSDPRAIASALESWLQEKQTAGFISGPPPESAAGLTRDEQFARAEQLLEQVRVPR
jgi:hypothetical protein